MKYKRVALNKQGDEARKIKGDYLIVPVLAHNTTRVSIERIYFYLVKKVIDMPKDFHQSNLVEKSSDKQ